MTAEEAQALQARADKLEDLLVRFLVATPLRIPAVISESINELHTLASLRNAGVSLALAHFFNGDATAEDLAVLDEARERLNA